MTLYYQKKNWQCQCIDIQAVFLNADMGIEMFVEWPTGMVDMGFITNDEYENTCIQLNKSQYGNIDAALQWMRIFTKDLTERVGLTLSLVDPCLFYKKDKTTGELLLLVVVYINDILCAGGAKEIKWFKKQVKMNNNITDLGQLRKHLGIWYEWKEDERGPYIKAEMNKMAEVIIEDYEAHTKKPAKLYKTPGIPGVRQIQTQNHLNWTSTDP